MAKKTPPTIAFGLCWRALPRRGPSRAFSEAPLGSGRSWAFHQPVCLVNAYLLKKFLADAAKGGSYSKVTAVMQLTQEGKRDGIFLH